MIVGFWPFGPCSMVLLLIVALPPFGRSIE